MTIAQATRGYLYPRFLGQYICGEGPRITSVQENAPVVSGGALVSPDTPSLVGSVEPGPEISTASRAETPGDDAPIIAGSDKPKIN